MSRGMQDLQGNTGQNHRVAAVKEIRRLQRPGSQRLRQGQIRPVKPDRTACRLLQILHTAHMIKMTMGQSNGDKMQIFPPEPLGNLPAVGSGIYEEAVARPLPADQIAIGAQGSQR